MVSLAIYKRHINSKNSIIAMNQLDSWLRLTSASRKAHPSKEYAASSFRVVFLHSAHFIRSSTQNLPKGAPFRASAGICVIVEICHLRDSLLPRNLPSLLKNSTTDGARSSCRVQPRVNHLLR
jgi:hypothetical protein